MGGVERDQMKTMVFFFQSKLLNTSRKNVSVHHLDL